MKRFLAALILLVLTSTPVLAQRRTIEEEKQRFQTLLGYARTADVPSRHTAHEEMVKFNQWIDAELLGRLTKATDQERQLFWTVLYDRRCRQALESAYRMFDAALKRCREAQIAVQNVYEMRQRAHKLRRDGNAAAADRLDEQANTLRGSIPWNEITLGNEVSILVGFFIEFGHEREFRKLMEVAIDSSMDDPLAKGLHERRWRTYRDDPLPGGTEMWNTVYTSVWEGVQKLARRPMDAKQVGSARDKFFKHFEELAKKKDLGQNQQAALENFEKAKGAMLKTDTHRGEDAQQEDDEGEGIIRK